MLIRRPRASLMSKVSGPWADRHAKDLFTYEMLLQRELEQDAMLWFSDRSGTVFLSGSRGPLNVPLAQVPQQVGSGHAVLASQLENPYWEAFGTSHLVGRAPAN